MKTARFLALFLTLLPVASGFAAPAPPEPRARCATCGMYVTAYPEWVAALLGPDGRALYFDGPKDMFKHLYFGDGKKDAGTLEAWVTVEGRGFQPARSAVFVVGSDLLGPMGDDLWPLADEGEAAAFMKKHGGKVVKFVEITPEVVRGLD